MKKYILFAVAIAAISITSCRKIETDGEKEIIVINGGGGSTTGQTISSASIYFTNGLKNNISPIPKG
jgi:hypothetical protein